MHPYEHEMDIYIFNDELNMLGWIMCFLMSRMQSHVSLMLPYQCFCPCDILLFVALDKMI